MILCVGEVLWDVFPGERFLGGAPFNVACHLRALGQEVMFASRVGSDALGEEIVAAVEERGMATALVQRDERLATGVVEVTFPAPDRPEYEICYPSAWDAIAFTPEVQSAASGCAALVFGTLAQRDPRSAATIHRALEACRGVRVCDLNLRRPHTGWPVITSSLERADWLKLNDEELELLRGHFALPGSDEAATLALAERFRLTVVCVTRGGKGAGLRYDGAWYEHAGYRVDVVDTVGAGDSFLASLLGDLLSGREPKGALARANAVAAYVASRASATPALDQNVIAGLMGS